MHPVISLPPSQRLFQTPDQADYVSFVKHPDKLEALLAPHKKTLLTIKLGELLSSATNEINWLSAEMQSTNLPYSVLVLLQNNLINHSVASTLLLFHLFIQSCYKVQAYRLTKAQTIDSESLQRLSHFSHHPQNHRFIRDLPTLLQSSAMQDKKLHTALAVLPTCEQYFLVGKAKLYDGLLRRLMTLGTVFHNTAGEILWLSNGLFNTIGEHIYGENFYPMKLQLFTKTTDEIHTGITQRHCRLGDIVFPGTPAAKRIDGFSDLSPLAITAHDRFHSIVTSDIGFLMQSLLRIASVVETLLRKKNLWTKSTMPMFSWILLDIDASLEDYLNDAAANKITFSNLPNNNLVRAFCQRQIVYPVKAITKLNISDSVNRFFYASGYPLPIAILVMRDMMQHRLLYCQKYYFDPALLTDITVHHIDKSRRLFAYKRLYQIVSLCLAPNPHIGDEALLLSVYLCWQTYDELQLQRVTDLSTLRKLCCISYLPACIAQATHYRLAYQQAKDTCAITFKGPGISMQHITDKLVDDFYDMLVI